MAVADLDGREANAARMIDVHCHYYPERYSKLLG